MSDKPLYSYCSTQVNVPEPLKSDILRYDDDSIDKADINEEAGGIEREVHVTILYGITSMEGLTAIQKHMPAIVKAVPSIKVRLSEISAFETNPEFDVLKIAVVSKQLEYLHELFKKITDFESDYPDYNPHLTLAYLKKGTAKKYVLDERFMGQEFHANQFLFCNNNGTKTPMPLGGDTNKMVNESAYSKYARSFYGL